MLELIFYNFILHYDCLCPLIIQIANECDKYLD